MSIVFTALILCALNKIAASFNVYLEDASLDYINPEYMDADNSVLTTIDNNGLTSNFTIVKTFPEETEIHVKILGMSMGKYTLPTGIDFWLPLCEVENEPILLGPFFAGLGIFDNGCPPSPGSYTRERYTLQMENLPNDFPNNKYEVICYCARNGEIIFKSVTYIDVQ